ncbi:MAG: putative lipid II flippase FtsW [Gammaproteobacteria bacterium]
MQQAQARNSAELGPWYDGWLLGAAVALLALGLVMVASASVSLADRQFGQPFYYSLRQFLFVGVGLAAAAVVVRTRLMYWEKGGVVLLIVGAALLVMVLIPGVGRQVNGSTRWLPFGVFNLQASELVKLFVIVYLAGYLVRRGEEVRNSIKGFLKPLAILAVLSVLLLLEPDFGSTAVMFATALAMMFLAGVRLWEFFALLAVVVAALAGLAMSSPYRLERLTTFLNPWADPFNSGFQLTQALIAIGRGEWFGVGLGGSIQKLFYLPEAHTDFLFAVLAEELGLLGVVSVIVLFTLVVWRAFVIAYRSEQSGNRFAGYLAYGIGMWIGLQAFINMGVNMGALPTKGLTLPLMSYGGSSIIVMCIAVALVLRVDYETRFPRGRSGR